MFGRVLSIQSHVVSGYVGNKAAAFPLQLLGFDVDIINSVQFSNHTGYRNKWRGHRLSGDDLLDLVAGMEDNGLLKSITHVLTGYVGSASFLRAVAQVVTKLRASNPELVYVCDPVLGDNGKLYTPPELTDIYRDEVCPLANVLTPNHFELERLSRLPIRTTHDLTRACATLRLREHGKIVVTSTEFSESKVAMFALEQQDGGLVHRLSTARLPARFTGSGDLTAALLLAWMARMPGDFPGACRHAMAGVAGVLRNTVEAGTADGECSMPELRLIDSANEIMNPPLDIVSDDNEAGAEERFSQ